MDLGDTANEDRIAFISMVRRRRKALSEQSRLWSEIT